MKMAGRGIDGRKNSCSKGEEEPKIKQFLCCEDVPSVKFMYLVFTRMPGESYQGRLGSIFCVGLSGAH